MVIAKLDRLSRNLAFIATLMDSGVEFVAVDNPHTNKLTIHILAAVAEDERESIRSSVGIPRRLNRHQIEFSFVTFIRACGKITKLRLTPKHVYFVHRRSLTSEMRNFFGCDVEFSAKSIR